ncbi:AraC family transcriptional regulator [Erysipelotrichaceae bacterium]|nr:AraC family transcriptional regulator [Erysipelotrichaceae bacterium]
MKNYSLEKILDLNKWQNLQDSLSQLTQLAILTIDYKGNPITTHSACSDFCKRVRADEVLSKRCQKCDSRGGFEAVCSNKPYIYMCHFNIVDIAIPISVNDRYIGAIMAGQVRLSDEDSSIGIEQLHTSPTGMTAFNKSSELQNLYNELPILPYEKIEAISEMLSCLCNYIVDEAKNKNYLLDLYLNVNAIKTPTGTSPLAMEQDITKLKSSLSHAISNVYIENFVSKKESILSPIIEYLNVNRGIMLSLSDAASLVHLSPGYFSRIFSKEVGMPYSVYLMQLKVDWSKQLLEKTTLSVTQISDELGFSDPSYFIKVFKKQEAITPLLYRNYIHI